MFDEIVARPGVALAVLARGDATVRAQVVPKIAGIAGVRDVQVSGVADQVVLVDLDGAIGIDAIAELCSISPARVLALTVSRDVSVHDGAILAGARGVVTRSAPVASLLKACLLYTSPRPPDPTRSRIPSFA